MDIIRLMSLIIECKGQRFVQIHRNDTRTTALQLRADFYPTAAFN